MSHLLFVDDCILFGEATARGARLFSTILREYRSCSAKVLKSKYYPQSTCLEVRLGNIPSFTWKSICASKKLLQDGLCWRVGNGKDVSIWNDCWVPEINVIKRQDRTNGEELELVSNLIDSLCKKWKSELVINTFLGETTQKILKIPLAKTDQADSQVWKGEQSGEYFVHNAYKLLQESTMDPSSKLLQADSKKFYMKL
ncbi:hypothetical protein J1N35_013887 [Gossypium stocksii]|uniref:Reverse transcriptase domain-containing protein n=1 Tax=Gossypium stocksii TaxID=47602 RepID=A0A9D4A984_9ROSI|nr:hypothetical protein J1N35_013887 [Gossypium stocksii]